MKHIFLLFLTILSFNAHAKGDAIDLINRRGVIRCGVNLEIKDLAYKDTDGYWQGADAQICKILATAILGHPNSFELVDIKAKNISKYLSTAQIDVAIGGINLMASTEAQSNIASAATIYYDSLKFLAYKKEGASSMLDYKGDNLCLYTANKFNHTNITNYIQKYNLKFNILYFKTRDAAKEAFMLKRCQILADQEIYLKSINRENAIIIDETIASTPINILINKKNHNLKSAIKWIINALLLAEEANINKNTISLYATSKDPLIQNLLGYNKTVWQNLKLHPDWLQKVITQIGNYKEFYNNNLEKIGIKRDQSNLIKNNGLMKTEIFL